MTSHPQLDGTSEEEKRKNLEIEHHFDLESFFRAITSRDHAVDKPRHQLDCCQAEDRSYHTRVRTPDAAGKGIGISAAKSQRNNKSVYSQNQFHPTPRTPCRVDLQSTKFPSIDPYLTPCKKPTAENANYKNIECVSRWNANSSIKSAIKSNCHKGSPTSWRL